MTERELLKKLNNLQTIKPGEEFKTRNREILLSQISASGGEEKISWFDTLEYLLPERLTAQLAKPAWAVFLIAALVLGGGALSLRAAGNTKPGDSLYIAKLISEKTQLALTFNEKEKVKLNLEFASNRAEESAQVMEEPGDGEKSAQIEKLSQNFKKEITAAKMRLAKIEPTKNQAGDDSLKVIGANLGKTDQRMEVAETTEKPVSASPVPAEKATSSASSTAAAVLPPANNLETALNEAEKLFDQQDYSGTLVKIKEVNNIIDNPTTANTPVPSSATTTAGEVKTGTTTSTK